MNFEENTAVPKTPTLDLRVEDPASSDSNATASATISSSPEATNTLTPDTNLSNTPDYTSNLISIFSSEISMEDPTLVLTSYHSASTSDLPSNLTSSLPPEIPQK